MPFGFGKKKKDETPAIDIKNSPMFKYTGATPQDTAAEINAAFRIGLDRYKSGALTKDQLCQIYLGILNENLSVYYASSMPNVPKLLGDTTGMDNQTRPVFQETYDKAFRMWMGFPG